MKGREKTISRVLDIAISLGAIALLLYQLFFVDEFVSESSALISLNSYLQPFLVKLFSIVFLTLSYAIWLKIIQSYKFFEDSQLKLLPFVLLFLLLNPVFFVNIENATALLFLTIMVTYVLKFSKQQNILGAVFTAGLCLGMSTLLFAPALLFLPYIWISIGIFKTFELRNYVISLVGFSFPFFYYFALVYLFDWAVPTFKIAFDSEIFHHSPKLSVVLLYLTLAVLSLFSIFRLFSHRTKMIVQQRKQMQSIVMFVLFALAIIFFSPSTKQPIVFSAFPLMICYGFLQRELSKRWIFQVLLFLLFIAYTWQLLFGQFPFL